MKIALILLLIFAANPAFPAVIREFSGKVYVQSNNKNIRINKKYNLAVGEGVTTRQNGTCLIDISDQNVFFRMAPASSLVLNWDNEFKLNNGMVWVRKRADTSFIILQAGDIKIQFSDAVFFVKTSERLIEIIVKSGNLLVQNHQSVFNLAQNSFLSIQNGNVPEIRGATDGEFIEWNEPFE